MKYRHLTDEEIQSYLDNQLESDAGWVKVHIDECGFCRNQLAQYKSLYAELGKEPDYSLSENSMNVVMNRIGDREGSKSPLFGKYFLLSVFSVVATVACASYFLDIRKVIDGMLRLHKSQMELLGSSVDFTYNIIKGMNLEPSSIALAAIILSIILLFDLLLSGKISRVKSKS